MSILNELLNVTREAKKEIEEILPAKFVKKEEHELANATSGEIFHADNLRLLKGIIDDPELHEKYYGKISFIYIDPPFFSGSDYDAVIRIGNKNVKHYAYQDSWGSDIKTYLKELCKRLILMHEILAEDGTIFLHLDWHAVHYAKIIMDEIFGEKNFVNEIIWTYKSGGSSKKRFSRKHDNILMYSKSSKYKFNTLKEKSYNRGLKPYRFKGVEEFEDEIGWYTLVNMKDVWTIDMVGRTSSERNGYATQKPEQLLERIIDAASDEGDIVADFFSGSGTLAATCAKKNRKFLTCDIGELSIASTLERVKTIDTSYSLYAESLDLANTLENSDCEKRKCDLGIKICELADKFEISISPEFGDEYILSWEIDFDFDGHVFRPDVMIPRNKGEIDCKYIGKINENEEFRKKNICIKVTNVYGIVTYERL